MRKKIFRLLSIILLLPISVFALDYPNINSKVIEIYDLVDKKILYEIKANEQVSIASLTKIATTITAIENITDVDEKVTITYAMLKNIRWDASVAGLKSGDVLTYRDLLYASMLPSGADATTSLAILSSGSIDNFVNKMNALVEKIGLLHTHFVNVTGLDESNHYSTADDIRKLLEYSLENTLFRDIFYTKEYTMSNGKKVSTTLDKYNNGLDVSKIIGSKTGFTSKAGYCLASLSDINGHEMLTIVLNASKENNNYYNVNDTVKIIDFLNDNYQEVTLLEKGKLVKSLPVRLSQIDSYALYSKHNIKKYLPSDYDVNDLKIVYDGLEELSFQNKVKEKIGTISYYYKDELLLEEEHTLKEEIKMDIIKVLKEYYYYVIAVIILLISIIILVICFIRKKHHKVVRIEMI